MKNIKEVLIKYRDVYGFSVIPVGSEKKPLVAWKEYQKRKATDEEIELWINSYPNMNIGIVTGAISDIVVVDIEKDGPTNGYPVTVSSKTGGGGYHLYYKYPQSGLGNSTRIKELTDIRGDGGYVVAPPSLHNSGKQYYWSIEPENSMFEEFPFSMFTLEKKDTEKNDWDYLFSGPIEKGSRNDSAAKVAGKLIQGLGSSISQNYYEVAYKQLEFWNSSACNPPLDKEELRNVFESIKRANIESNKEGSKNPNGTLAKNIVSVLLADPDIAFFKDQYDEANAHVNLGDSYETWDLGSSNFTGYIYNRVYESMDKALNREDVGKVTQILTYKAKKNGEEHELHNRVAMKDQCLYYDLANKKREIIKVSPGKGFEIIDGKEILFKRSGVHQKSQVTPVINDFCLKDILTIVNIDGIDGEILYLCGLVVNFIPGFPHSAMYIYGDQGSAKSTTCQITKEIVDPSNITRTTLPENEKAFAETINQSYFLVYDNMSSISAKQNDFLCRAITHSAFTKRKEYTVNELVVLSLQTILMFNGINICPGRPDLLERCLLLEASSIDSENRKTEEEVKNELKKILPGVLGFIFETISKAMVVKENMEKIKTPRMADYVMWCCAVAEVLGYGKEAYLKAYENNNQRLLVETAMNDVCIKTLIEVINKSANKNFEGTANELLEKIRDHVGWTPEAKFLPQSESSLSKKINRFIVPLKGLGIIVDKKKSVNRILYIYKVQDSAVDAVEKSNPESQQEAF